MQMYNIQEHQRYYQPIAFKYYETFKKHFTRFYSTHTIISSVLGS